jgi:hypothetical protein
LKTYTGSFYIHLGSTEFNLPITADTTEIIFLDLDNSSSWNEQFLNYVKQKNGGKFLIYKPNEYVKGDKNKSNVLCLGVCGIVYENPIKSFDFIYIIQMDIAAKEAADHAITFFAGRILIGTRRNVVFSLIKRV